MLPLAIITTLMICSGVAAAFLFWLAVCQGSRYEKLKQTNDHLYQENDSLRQDVESKREKLNSVQSELEITRVENDQLTLRKQELSQDIADSVRQVEQLKESFETTEEQFRRNYMTERRNWLDERTAEYVQMQADFVDQFKEENRKKLDAAHQLTETIAKLRSTVDAAVEVAKRHAEEENFIAYHSLQMEERWLVDIKRLEDLVPSISPEAGEAIAKIIWKVYYEKPYGDLVGRVIGPNRLTGIYRITSTRDSRCYVGQAVDIADRWRQHIKRALNAEPRTQNKLYPAMYQQGIENFTFEVIEECSRDKLNEREDYWQEFYHAKDYGYSIK